MSVHETQFKNLEDVGSVRRGKSKHRPRNDPDLYGGPYPFIQTGDVIVVFHCAIKCTPSETLCHFAILRSLISSLPVDYLHELPIRPDLRDIHALGAIGGDFRVGETDRFVGMKHLAFLS